MKNTKDMFKTNNNLKENFYKNMKDGIFEKIINSLEVNNDILYKYTSLIEDSCSEIKNCSKCKGLQFCKNELKGYYNMPIIDNEDISFVYKACKYKEKETYKKNINLFDMPSNLKNAKMKDIYIDDKSRIEVIKYIDNYFKKFPSDMKGLYLHGNFGCGKTYLIAALFNELAKSNIKSAIIYFPEFLRTLKASFQKYEESEGSFSEKYEYIKKVPLLLIDDIGAENVTPWGRDEILGTLLQYRMNENLPTFFTSNLTIEELESHLAITSKDEDKVKARRIIERIKCLSSDMKLIGESRR